MAYNGNMSATATLEARMPKKLPRIGPRLKRLREAAGLTQRELAEKAKVGSSTIFKLEQGLKDDVMASTAAALAEALGCSVDELIGFKPKRRRPPPAG